MNTSEWCKLGHRHTSYVAVLESFKESHTPVFSLGFLEGQGGDSDCKKPGSFNRKSNKDF